MKIEQIIKLILALLFLLCLFDMPYGFYEFVRFSALLGFAILAYKANERENKTEMIIYIGLALLFQPIFKISLGRSLWNIIDVVVGIYLIGSTMWKKKNANSI